MKIKYLVGAMIIIYALFMASVAMVGFVQKQQKEESLSEQGQENPSPENSSQTNSSTTSPKVFIATEVAMHNKQTDCWIIIDAKVYDVGKFLDVHPGGSDLIIPFCGKDATQAFNTQGGRRSSHSQNARNLLQQYLIGTVQ